MLDGCTRTLHPPPPSHALAPQRRPTRCRAASASSLPSSRRCRSRWSRRRQPSLWWRARRPRWRRSWRKPRVGSVGVWHALHAASHATHAHMRHPCPPPPSPPPHAERKDALEREGEERAAYVASLEGACLCVCARAPPALPVAPRADSQRGRCRCTTAAGQINDAVAENMELRATLEGTAAQCQALEGALAEQAGAAAQLAAQMEARGAELEAAQGQAQELRGACALGRWGVRVRMQPASPAAPPSPRPPSPPSRADGAVRQGCRAGWAAGRSRCRQGLCGGGQCGAGGPAGRAAGSARDAARGARRRRGRL